MNKRTGLITILIIISIVVSVCFVHTHSYAEELIKPDCIHDGIIIYSCECGHTYTKKESEALGHNYKTSIIHPTCDKMGYTLHSCSCGDIYKDNFVEKTEHSFSDWTLAIPPSKDNDGEEFRVCACGKKETRTYVCPHNSVVENIVIENNCQNTGLIQTVCSDCSKVISESILPTTNHKYSDWTIIQHPAPNTDGIKERYCINCKIKDSDVIKFSMAGPNSIYIPGTGINVKYVVEEFTQKAVDENDVICNYTRLSHKNPVILGHNTGSLKKLYNAAINSNIYLSVDGVISTYKIIVSEKAIETKGQTEFQGLNTGYELFNDKNLGQEGLCIYTCYQDKELGKIRWIVYAVKV